VDVQIIFEEIFHDIMILYHIPPWDSQL